MSMRKRPHAINQDAAEDELSPGKAHANTLLLPSKRRKLNDESSPGRGTSFRKIGEIGKVIGGYIGLGGGKSESRKDNLEADDELGDREGDMWQIEDSDGDQYATLKARKTLSTPRSKENKSPSNVLKTSRIAAPDELGDDVDIYEIPGSEDEEDEDPGLGLRKTALASVERAKAKLAARKESSPEKDKKRPVGRPRKSNGSSQQNKSTNGLQRKADTESHDEIQESGKEQEQTPSKHNRGQHAEFVSPSTVNTTVRKRGRPRKNLDALIESAKRSQPKGILTPSKKDKTLKARKSVVFQYEDTEMDLGFKDLPSKQGTKTSESSMNASKPLLQDGPKDQYDELDIDEDTPCTVCAKIKDSKSNPMLICDGCDSGLHLRCSNLDAVPGGSWFCNHCQSQELQSPSPQEAAAHVEDEKDELGSDEEVACAICSGIESAKGNKIILCEGCPFSVHIKCYQLLHVPRGDWYCKDCKARAEQERSRLGIERNLAADEPAPDLPDIQGFEIHLRNMQKALLDKLTGQKRMKLRGHDDEMQKVYQVVEQTVVAGEGNSMLIIGARGCGKTTLVDSVISDLSAEHREEFHVVRLNGFIHTDDKLALKEIWRQLGREMEIEDDHAAKPINHADTLASLLALLSHPSELSETQANQTTKSVIFILDEFDLFTTHSRQTLLYNLFDIAQARKAPIAILGLTTRVDVVESLEKRVKSRFSHRYVHLSRPKSLPAFWDICKQGLTFDPEGSKVDLLASDEPGRAEFSVFWQSMIDDLYTNDDEFKNHLSSHFYRTKSVPEFLTSCILPIANLSTSNFPLTGRKLTLPAMSLSAPDSKLHILQGLSELELALLIAAARLDIILDTDTCNFAMAYDEYTSLTSRHKIQTSSTGVAAIGSSAKLWGREVALGSWERLAEYELLVPAGIGGGGNKDSGAAGRMWKADVGLEEITGSVQALNGVMTKWCREI